MIKVIASDMDGTLLGDDHMPAPETVRAVKKACGAGIRFMIATGRNYSGAVAQLKDTGIVCDYILGSGAEVRDPQSRIAAVNPISMELVREVYDVVKAFPVSVIFGTGGYDYRIGTSEEIEESFILQLQMFHSNLSREELVKTPVYQQVKKSTKHVSGIGELEELGIPVYKVFLFSMDTDMLDQIREKLEKNPGIAVAASFSTNLEITDVKAQKGPVLKEYIESLGYTMDEVMVLGDSLNDYSMISMDFGATVAMGNAVPEIKKAAKYVTKTNTDLGVACAIEELLKRR